MNRNAGIGPEHPEAARLVYRPRRWQRLGGVKQMTLQQENVLVEHAGGARTWVPLRPAPVIDVDHDHGASGFYRYAGALLAFVGAAATSPAPPVGLALFAAGGAAIFKHIEGFSLLTMIHGPVREHRTELRIGAPPDDLALQNFLLHVRRRASDLGGQGQGG